MTYSFGSGCLTESQTPGAAVAAPAPGGPYFTWPVAARRTTCLLRSTTAPALTYYDAAGAAAPGLNGIRSVVVQLTAQDPDNSSISGVPARTRISLENLINADGSV